MPKAQESMVTFYREEWEGRFIDNGGSHKVFCFKLKKIEQYGDVFVVFYTTPNDWSFNHNKYYVYLNPLTYEVIQTINIQSNRFGPDLQARQKVPEEHVTQVQNWFKKTALKVQNSTAAELDQMQSLSVLKAILGGEIYFTESNGCFEAHDRKVEGEGSASES